jgi:phospholipase C
VLSLKGTRNIFFVALVLAGGSFAKAQTTKAQHNVSPIGAVKPNTPTFSQFRAASGLQDLAKNRRNFSAAPPDNLASELAAVTLPAVSSKLHSLTGLSRADFLASHTLEPNDIHTPTLLGLDRRKIFSARIPRIDGKR